MMERGGKNEGMGREKGWNEDIMWRERVGNEGGQRMER